MHRSSRLALANLGISTKVGCDHRQKQDALILTTISQAPVGGLGRSRHVARNRALVVGALVALVLPQAASAATDDPWEPANSTFYMVHRVLDDAVFSRLAAAFRIIPAPIRKAVRNVIANLGEPGVAANDLLQGHPVVTLRTLGRFGVNTSVGLGGLMDVAATTGLPHHDNNFANTFGRWGAPAGPYLFITLLGPTTVRDGAGAIADTLTDPFTWSRFYHRWTAIDVRTLWGGLDQRVEADEQLRAIDNMSTDSYASLRSLYLQNRAAQIASPPGALPGSAPLQTLPDFGDVGADPEPAAPAPPAPPPPPPQPKPITAQDAPPLAAADPSSQVLSNHRHEDKLLAALALAAEATL